MINILEEFYSRILHNKEYFKSGPTLRTVSLLPMILAVLTVEILLLVVGKFLWNNYLVKSVTIVNPINSIVELFAISFLLRLLLT